MWFCFIFKIAGNYLLLKHAFWAHQHFRIWPLHASEIQLQKWNPLLSKLQVRLPLCSVPRLETQNLRKHELSEPSEISEPVKFVKRIMELLLSFRLHLPQQAIFLQFLAALWLRDGKLWYKYLMNLFIVMKLKN